MDPEISGYWEGYTEYNIDPYRLLDVPTYINIIPIAFIGITGNSTWEWGIASQQYTSEEIINDINIVTQRGQKILFSLLDNKNLHWDQIDIPTYVNSIATAVTEYGLSGVDIDAESGMNPDDYVTTFIKLITTLRSVLGPDKLITYTCYTMSEYDQQILTACKNDIDIVHTMAYWDNFDDMMQLFTFYGNLVGNDKISLGVSVTQTSLEEIQQLGSWCVTNGYNKMMLWSLTQDVQEISSQLDGTWSQTIYNSLLPQK